MASSKQISLNVLLIWDGLVVKESLGFWDISAEKETELVDLLTLYLKLQLIVGLKKQVRNQKQQNFVMSFTSSF